MKETMKVECTECNFRRLVDSDDEERPADAVIEHGRQTGHKLTVAPVEESETSRSRK